MLHFPSTANGYPKRSDSLNATQSKSHSNPLLLKIEEEVHDARRVQSHGQEEDLRAALNVVINHVAELSSMLNEAYKAQAELEVQLNVTKSNLQLVIANNEMLEEALKRETNGHTQDVGWHRASGNRRSSDERSKSVDRTSATHARNDSNPGSSVSSPVVSASSIPTPTSASAPAPPTPTPQSSQDSRFFRFRFTGSISSRSSLTRPTTPTAHHLTSPSMPVLPTIQTREIEELTSQLEKERTARKTISDEKAALEAELESLSQALFEEANKMVATERMKRAETEEELKEARLEQEALRSALRVVEGENSNLREASQTAAPSSSEPTASSSNHDADTTSSADQDKDQVKSRLELVRTRLRSSSQVAMKSPITSPRCRDSDIPFPSSPDPEARPHTALPVLSSGTESHLLSPDASTNSTATPTRALPIHDIPPHPSPPPSPLPRSASAPTLPSLYDNEEPSPWADVPPRASEDLSSATPRSSLFSAASVYTLR